MANYDGSVRISAKMDNSDFTKGAEQVEKKLDTIEEKVKTGPPINWKEYAETTAKIAAEVDKNVAAMDKNNSSVKEANEHFNFLRAEVESYADALKELETQGKYYGDEDWNDVYIRLQNAIYAVKQYKAELDSKTEEGMAKAAAKATKEAEKQVAQQRKLEEAVERRRQREVQILEKQAAQEAKLKAELAEQQRLESIRSNAVVSNQNLVDLLREQQTITARMADLKKAGVADGYKEYDELKARLAQINTEIKGAQNGFVQAANSSKKCFGVLQKGTKRTNGLLATMGSRLKGIALSLLVFNWISKGFNAMVSAMKAGFQNLAQYSKDYNKVMSDMKSQSATLKNSLATAFEPIVTTIVPYITRLISWLNTAMNYIAQFWAVLSGKDTYTRAKKQVVDYAKSLKDASGSAQGALASFDEINVLNKDDGSSAAGGEVTGADAFEEAEVDQNKFTWVEWLKDNLDEILTLVQAIGLGFLAWKLSPVFIGTLSTVLGIAIAAWGAFQLVKNAIDAWQNGIDWENLRGMLLGATALIVGLGIAFGSVGMAIGALIAGIVLLVVGIKDIIENGVNLKNSLAVIAGTFLLVSSVAGVVIGFIAALVAGLVLAIVADWENFKRDVIDPLWDWLEALLSNTKETIEGVKRIFKGIINFITGVFTGNWKKAWQGIKDIFAGVWQSIKGTVKLVVNTIIGIINTMVNGLAGAINAVIRAINSINITIPDWVPFWGGNSYSPNIPTIPKPANIPYLEYGGTVTQETYAKISEGNRKEVVLPLEQHTEWADLLAEKVGGGTTVIRFEGSLAELGRILKPVIDTENSRVGRSLVQA